MSACQGWVQLQVMALVLVSSLLLTGCGGSNSDTGDNDPGPQVTASGELDSEMVLNSTTTDNGVVTSSLENHYFYDATLKTVTLITEDEAQEVSLSVTYDAFDRKTSEVTGYHFVNEDSSSYTIEQFYFYDEADNLVRETYSEYDSDNQLTRYGQRDREYDSSGTLLLVYVYEDLNSDGVADTEGTITYDYNPQGLPINVLYAMSDSPQMEVTTTYNEGNQVVATIMHDYSSGWLFKQVNSYDEQGRLISRQHLGQADTGDTPVSIETTSYGYDEDDNLTSEVYYDNRPETGYCYNRVSYFYYDERGNQTFNEAHYDRNCNGDVEQLEYIDRTFNEHDRLVSLHHETYMDDDLEPTSWYRYDYSYNADQILIGAAMEDSDGIQEVHWLELGNIYYEPFYRDFVADMLKRFPLD